MVFSESKFGSIRLGDRGLGILCLIHTLMFLSLLGIANGQEKLSKRELELKSEQLMREIDSLETLIRKERIEESKAQIQIEESKRRILSLDEDLQNCQSAASQLEDQIWTLNAQTQENKKKMDVYNQHLAAKSTLDRGGLRLRDFGFNFQYSYSSDDDDSPDLPNLCFLGFNPRGDIIYSRTQLSDESTYVEYFVYDVQQDSTISIFLMNYLPEGVYMDSKLASSNIICKRLKEVMNRYEAIDIAAPVYERILDFDRIQSNAFKELEHWKLKFHQEFEGVAGDEFNDDFTRVTMSLLSEDEEEFPFNDFRIWPPGTDAGILVEPIGLLRNPCSNNTIYLVLLEKWGGGYTSYQVRFVALPERN